MRLISFLTNIPPIDGRRFRSVLAKLRIAVSKVCNFFTMQIYGRKEKEPKAHLRRSSLFRFNGMRTISFFLSFFFNNNLQTILHSSHDRESLIEQESLLIRQNRFRCSLHHRRKNNENFRVPDPRKYKILISCARSFDYVLIRIWKLVVSGFVFLFFSRIFY